jgi:ribosome-associated heat shock protein Hsp15
MTTPASPVPGPQPGQQPGPQPGQRIDKWLWYTRVFKSRSLAAKFVETGKIRVKTGEQRSRLTKPSQTIRVGDILTFQHHDHIMVLEVCAPGKRRGPASEAQTLYKDLSPARPTREEQKLTQTAPSRAKGEGRPTKRDRRALDKLQDPGET